MLSTAILLSSTHYDRRTTVSALSRRMQFPRSIIHWILTTRTFPSPSNLNPITSCHSLIPLSHAILGSSMLTSIGNLHIQIGISISTLTTTKNKLNAAATLLHRALNLPNSETSKAREIAREIRAALQSNGYPPKITTDIIRKKSSTPTTPTPVPEELVNMFFKWADQTNQQNFPILPYIKGITEPLTRILKSHDIQVTNKRIKTHKQEFPAPKFRPPKDDQCNVAYKIPCASCPWKCVGETKRSFSTRKKEHIRNALKVQMLQNMHGFLTMKLTLRILRLLTKKITALERHLSHGIRPKLLRRTIIHAYSPDNKDVNWLANKSFMHLNN